MTYCEMSCFLFNSLGLSFVKIQIEFVALLSSLATGSCRIRGSYGKSTRSFKSAFGGSLKCPIAQHLDNVNVDANVTPFNIMAKFLQEIIRPIAPGALQVQLEKLV